MPLDFLKASSQYCRARGAGAVPFTTTPLTLACWINLDTLPAGGGMPLWIGESSTATWDAWYLSVGADGALTAGLAEAHSFGGTSTAGTAAVGTWYHLCGVYASSTLRTAYVNGANPISDSATKTPAAGQITSVSVGASDASAAGSFFFDGKVADAAMWNTNLTADEVAGLGRGVNPMNVRPGNLVRYWPLGMTAGTTDTCWRTGSVLSRINTPTVVAPGPPTSRMRM